MEGGSGDEFIPRTPNVKRLIVCYDPSACVVGKLDDVFVAAAYRGTGIGTRVLKALKVELRKNHIGRIDTAVHRRNPGGVVVGGLEAIYKYGYNAIWPCRASNGMTPRIAPTA